MYFRVHAFESSRKADLPRITDLRGVATDYENPCRVRAWRGFDGHTCVRPSRGEPLLRRVGWPCHERADQLQEDLSWQLGQRQLSRCTHSSTARSDADAQRQLGVRGGL